LLQYFNSAQVVYTRGSLSLGAAANKTTTLKSIENWSTSSSSQSAAVATNHKLVVSTKSIKAIDFYVRFFFKFIVFGKFPTFFSSPTTSKCCATDSLTVAR
jgi:hypothetical protein